MRRRRMTLEDLRGYRPEWVKPISRSYRGYELHEIPPNGQGIAALIALGIGRAPKVGEHFRFPDAAYTLRASPRPKGRDF